MILLIGDPGQRINKGHGSKEAFKFEFSADAFLVGTELPARNLFEIPVYTIPRKRVNTTLAGLATLFKQFFQTSPPGL